MIFLARRPPEVLDSMAGSVLGCEDGDVRGRQSGRGKEIIDGDEGESGKYRRTQNRCLHRDHPPLPAGTGGKG